MRSFHLRYALLALMIGAVLLARRNLRLGRGDRKGAFKLAMFVLAVGALEWVLNAHHTPEIFGELDLFFRSYPGTVFLAGMVWLVYIALEPFLRSRWPDAMVSWSRLLAGRFRDPLVGRDLLIGITASTVFGATMFGVWLFGMRQGLLPPLIELDTLGPMRGGRFAFGHLFVVLLEQIPAALGLLMLLLLLRIVFRRTWIAAVLFFLCHSVLLALQIGPFSGGQPAGVALGALFGGLQAVFFIVLATRFGLVAMIGAFVFSELSLAYRLPLSASSPYIGTTVFGWAVSLLLLGYAAWVSLAGRALFQMLGVFSEFERAMIQERVRSGLARARAQGKRLGRPPKATPRVRRKVLAARAQGHSMRQIARDVGVSPATVHAVVKAAEPA